VNRSESIAKLTEALSKAQGTLDHAKKDVKNEFFKSKYADLASVIDAAKKPLADNGLAVIQSTRITESGAIVLVTMLSHISGEWVSSEYPVNPVKSDPQGYGSALTYARRYAFSAITGVASEDDDGNSASGNVPAKNAKTVYGTNKAMVDKYKDIVSQIEQAETHEQLKDVWKTNNSHIIAMRNLDETYYEQLEAAKDKQKTAIADKLASESAYGQGFSNTGDGQ
jgi:hypothetical protein